MVTESGAVAAAVVAGEDIRCLALVERVGLAELHYAADVEVGPVGGIEIEIVPPAVGIFVGVAEAHVEHLGMAFLQGFHGHAISDAVEALGLFEAAVGYAGVHILHQTRERRVGVGRFMGAAGREAAALVVHREAYAFPRGVHHQLPFVARVAVGNLEHAHVRVGIGVVGAYTRIVGPAAEHLAVAGIREIHGVGDLHAAVQVAVAKKITVLRSIAPHKRHQGLAPLLRGFAPVFFLQLGGMMHETRISDQAFVGPAEEFLPAQAVKGDDYKTGVVASLAAGNQRRQRQYSCHEPFFHNNLLVDCVLR